MIPAYILFIEEAHNIIGLTGEARPSEENADPKAYATEFICRMMAECGGYEVPIVIIDQLPSAVAAAVVKHAGSLLAFRETHEEDREIVGSSTLASQAQREDIGRLATGEAYIFTDGYHCPRRIRTVNIHALVEFDKTVGDRQLLAIIRQEHWFRQMARQRVAAELQQLQEYMDDFEKQRVETVTEIKGIVAHRRRLSVLGAGSRDRGQLLTLRSQARSIRRRLEQSFQQFRRGIYHRYMPTGKDLNAVGQDLVDGVRHRYERVIEPEVKRLLAFLDGLIRRFMESGR